MDGQEREFLNETNIDDNYELQLKQRKFAKLHIFFSCLGIFAGVSASICFLFAYYLVQAPIVALFSGLIATFVCYIHVQFLRNLWQIYTYQLKYWFKLGIILQATSVCAFIVYLALGLANKEVLTVSSSYIVCVWCFMCWKWSFALYYFSKKYLNIFNRYRPISDISDNEQQQQ